ncbi:MAG TPA: SDR family NAD(P)-dependent oxidoreductase [Streptosporangiaceae bacterium]|nr:SDR family NAD(P)-dependent oxidoreductase [Streptosporangiaceae bacterium]
MTATTTLTGKTVLVTGASRGLGQALADQALARGAARVYAAARRPGKHPDPRVAPLRLDTTDAEQIRAAVEQIQSLDVLINNAGVSIVDDLREVSVIEAHLAVNLYGTYRVTQALLPRLTASGGAIVNVLSLAALATVPVTPAYAISKAAAFSMTQSLRTLLADQGVRVHAALPGPIDTDMIRDWDIPKTSPAEVAAAILDGVARGQEEIFPDPMSAALAPEWDAGPVKTLERANAAAVQAMAVSR